MGLQIHILLKKTNNHIWQKHILHQWVLNEGTVDSPTLIIYINQFNTIGNVNIIFMWYRVE